MTERRQQYHNNDQRRSGGGGGGRGNPFRTNDQPYQSAPRPQTSARGARSNHQPEQRYENASLSSEDRGRRGFERSAANRERRGETNRAFSSAVDGGRGATAWCEGRREERRAERRDYRDVEPMPKRSTYAASSSASRRPLQEQPMELDEERRDNRREERCVQRRDQSREGNREKQQEEPSKDRSPATITKIVPTKPPNAPSKQGTSGERVKLFANYFRILKKPTCQFYMYSVDFSPDIVSRSLKSGMLFQQIEPYTKGSKGLFDGTVLYLRVELESKVTKFVATSKKDKQPCEITVTLVGLASPDTHQYLHVWSVLLRKCEKSLGLQLVGRNYYDPIAATPIPLNGLQLWPGYKTAIHQHERAVLLCADISTKVMRSDTAYDVLRKCQHEDTNFKDTFFDSIVGKTVLTAYNNKTYKIADVDFDKGPASTFDLKNGETTSYIDYYRRHYNININDQGQPLLIVKSSKREERAGQATLIALVPELCFMTGFDEAMRKNNQLMKNVSSITKHTPNNHMKRLTDLIRRLKESDESKAIFREYEFEPESNPLALEGRWLKNETILFANQESFVPPRQPDWSQAFRYYEMYVSQHLLNWVLISSREDQHCAQNFVRTLQKATRGMKYTVKEPHYIDIFSTKGRDYKNAIEKGRNRDPQLFMCILPSQNADLYSAIKKACFIDHAVASQVIARNTITNSKSLMSVATKVAIQINSKLGGVPWMIKIDLKGLMTIGFDVSHDTVHKTDSYGAMVCTMDLQLKQKYFSCVDKHVSGAELSNTLSLNARKAMLEFRQEHGTFPEKILFYRDGVGAGQIAYVKQFEIENILASLSIEYGNRKVPLTFMVVTKRGNSRFFVKRGYQGGYENPRPGTVIDDEVTFPERYDFELISQYAHQGTVSPTNYNILHNEMGLSSDALQRLTYKQTHLYYNWSGTMSVPAVCQYAHKLAFMVANYMHDAPMNALQKKLYFL